MVVVCNLFSKVNVHAFKSNFSCMHIYLFQTLLITLEDNVDSDSIWLVGLWDWMNFVIFLGIY